MTTLVRVKTSPPASPSSYNGPQFDSASTQATNAQFRQRKVTFQPVAAPVITEIMGFVALGLSEMGLSGKSVPAMLFKWHTWLTRMNSWMKENTKIYPKYMAMPDVKIPANLYYLGTIPPEDWDTQVINAASAPLGPLLPQDKHTLLNALTKGVQRGGTGDTQNVGNTIQSFSSFIRDVSKISAYAIQPQKAKGIVTRSNKVAQLDIIPMPPVKRHNIVENFDSQQFRGVNVLPANENNTIPAFFKNQPLWVWVAVVAALLYFVNSESSTSSTTTYASPTYSTAPSAPSWSDLTGGSGRILDISQFR